MKKRFTFGFEFSVIHNFFFTRMDREKDASDFIFSEERLFSLKNLAIQNSGNIMLNVH